MGKLYDSCTSSRSKAPWCATTTDYAQDKKWGYCLTRAQEAVGGTIKTVGGSGNGAACVFPFIANGKCYDKCVKFDGEKNAWCSTSGNYDLDNEMGYCVDNKEVETTDGKKCAFPFLYNGRLVSNCVADNGGAWCSLTYNYDGDKQKGICKEDETKTYGGATGHERCAFPFLKDGQMVSNCIPDDDNPDVTMCATTHNYDLDKKKVYCFEQLKDDKNPQCTFPFFANGEAHLTCITATADMDGGIKKGQKWCGTTANYHLDKKAAACNEGGADAE